MASHLLLLTLLAASPILGDSSMTDDVKFGLKYSVYNIVSDHLAGKLPKNDMEALAAYFPKEIQELLPDLSWWLNSEKPYKPKGTLKESVSCEGCSVAVDALIEVVHLGVDFNTIATILTDVCPLVMNGEVCRGAIHNFKPQLDYILKHSPNATGGTFCSLALGGKCGPWEDIYGWNVTFSGRPNDVKPDFKPPTPPSADANKSQVLHLSDFHMDLTYQIGTDVDCGMPMCCMNSTPMATDPAKAAGDWGSYKCDLTRWTAEDMLQHIADEHKDEDFEYIMLTGDSPAHDIWLQSYDQNYYTTELYVNMVKKHFPGKKVVFSLGNHDSWPVNSFAPESVKEPGLDASVWYKRLAGLYDEWWGNKGAEARESFEKTGSYHFEMSPGFRMIVVNSNGALGYNFYMNMDYKDPFGLLPWLYDILLAAESKGEKVHILSHAPPGDNTVVTGWAKNWAKVVDRFANTISAQFYGHTHNDQFELWYDTETNSIPINVGYVTPSVTTFTGLNPSYRIYTVDGPYEGASMQITDVRTYVMDLAKANKGETKRPEYYLLYDHRKDLGMDNLYPKDFDSLARRLAVDDELLNKFFRYFNSNSYGNGNGVSKYDLICTMLRVSYVDESKCAEIIKENLDQWFFA